MLTTSPSLKLIGIALCAVVVAGGLWYISSLKEDISQLTEQSGELRANLKVSNATADKAAKVNERLSADLETANGAANAAISANAKLRRELNEVKEDFKQYELAAADYNKSVTVLATVTTAIQQDFARRATIIKQLPPPISEEYAEQCRAAEKVLTEALR